MISDPDISRETGDNNRFNIHGGQDSELINELDMSGTLITQGADPENLRESMVFANRKHLQQVQGVI